MRVLRALYQRTTTGYTPRRVDLAQKFLHVALRATVTIFVLGALQSCTLAFRMSVFNNTADAIEVCRPNLTADPCQQLASGRKLTLDEWSGSSAFEWQLVVNRGGGQRTYNYRAFGDQDMFSLMTCRGLLGADCMVNVQLESNGLVYWIGKSKQLPVVEFPPQPGGFPLAPAG